MEEIEIEGQFRIIGIVEMIIVILFLITFNVLFFSLTKLLLMTFLFGISEIILFFLIYKFKNNKVYYLAFLNFRPLFRESSIRISDEYITIKVQDRPYFFVFWRDVDTIEVEYKKIPYFHWKRFVRLISYEVRLNFIKQTHRSTLKLSSYNFNKSKYEQVISILKERAEFLNKSIIFQ